MRYKSEKSIKRKRQIQIKKLLLCTCSLFIITLVVLLFGTDAANANEEADKPAYKYYKSVCIDKGDTLWDIAAEHKGEESIEEYISTLKDINNLTSDNIEECKYLTVAYYDNTFR